MPIRTYDRLVPSLRITSVFIGTVCTLVLLPALLFMGVGIFRGMGLSASLTALGNQYLAARTNLFVITVLGILPLAVVYVLLGIRRLLTKSWEHAGFFALLASVPVVLVAIVMHLEYWPAFLPNQQFLGFPHGLEFIIGPFVFAPIGAAFGFMVAWFIARRS